MSTTAPAPGSIPAARARAAQRRARRRRPAAHPTACRSAATAVRSRLLRLGRPLCQVFRRRGDDAERYALRQRGASDTGQLARVARPLDQQEVELAVQCVIWPLAAEQKRTTRSGSVAAISRPSSRSSFSRSGWPLGRPHGCGSPSSSASLIPRPSSAPTESPLRFRWRASTRCLLPRPVGHRAPARPQQVEALRQVAATMVRQVGHEAGDPFGVEGGRVGAQPGFRRRGSRVRAAARVARGPDGADGRATQAMTISARSP